MAKVYPIAANAQHRFAAATVLIGPVKHFQQMITLCFCRNGSSR